MSTLVKQISLPQVGRPAIPQSFIPINQIIDSWELKPTKAERRELHQASLNEINNIDPEFFSRVQAVKIRLKKDLTRGSTSYGDPTWLKTHAKLVQRYAYHMGKASNHSDTHAVNVLALNLWRLGCRKLKDRSPNGINNVVKNIGDGILALWRLDKDCTSPERKLANKVLYEMEMDGGFSSKVRDLKGILEAKLKIYPNLWDKLVCILKPYPQIKILEAEPAEVANSIKDGILALWRTDPRVAESLYYNLEMEMRALTVWDHDLV